MVEYIDRDALLEKLANSSETWAKNIENIRNWWPHAVRIKDNIVAEIKRQPPADVEEVKHGRWIMRECIDECNLCHGVAILATDYCPNCGAKMDGEKDETK